jgi:hypothetical protein
MYTVYILTRLFVVDSEAIADSKSVQGAVLPKRMLNKSREVRGVGGIEAARVNPSRNVSQDIGATSRAIASGSIGMTSVKSSENSGPMKEVMD